MKGFSPSSRGFFFNFRILVGPLLLILIILSFAFYAATTGYGRVKKQIEEYRIAKKEETNLREKLASIKNIRPDVLDQADFTLVALPQKNPATFLISQLRLNAEESSITIKEISTSRSQKKDDLVNSMIINVDTESSDVGSITTFMENISDLTPISLIVGSEGTLNQTEAKYEQELEISFYWSALPTTLPSISEPLKNLTSEQTEILERISSLKQPILGDLKSQQPLDREIPFN
ncbi:hypothetical protein A2865_00020 [Candidatus Woesebacteria bacterium RIFCSPHIGHO2_01_FULL_39_17]|uniref:Uncharacterized protein n=2 Tax=Candidatus Woeseibacteriota TaxID=1752722 RepID=A0A0G0QV82_9BACT|nr:MAG: hypothetical protein US72_C0022G0015 [Microgenomates group bacterium GW2011_GWC1_38_12]KKQ93242.1 MAG: hypothetical protein UT19_C0015G0003 [Candidatus Woesebacteria bacterium GW2011_GWB1_39_10b]KKR14235.1 MAG: hypothetical protein UT40_C0004G0058 [Candidatus Woesebacteria bacterium GW2011_GWA1_39_21b]OGM23194.1 MAG: hypothetical protein A2865_00020 [Candidatus Woesebacteria bacterium RIFCSPHIGHO2_01_FULL_39_17]